MKINVGDMVIIKHGTCLSYLETMANDKYVLVVVNLDTKGRFFAIVISDKYNCHKRKMYYLKNDYVHKINLKDFFFGC